ncbi:MAG: bifunctional 5,10-methylenetetrahydrofolate dehydrogenase/5,10-methenyltetrahydrofolate cyclohydrolase [Clostridiales Family XIII bacterium]|nr:bifunctional 5,10-methylenetetrahydrofolate dehydrogenase/5,10-methenyltetrahydrofolate cyclohydrolase [Clostridiales Family XIII bacterium]
MAEIWKGAPAADALCEAAERDATALSLRGTVPTLAVVRIGERPSDLAYERGAMKRCGRAGVSVRSVTLPADVTQERLIGELQRLNADDAVHGVLLFRPLPEGLDDDAVRNTLSPEKDVDGITDLSLAGVFTGTGAGYAPCTARACMELLDYYGVDPKGKNAVVIGRSLVIGRPVAMLMLARHATVTLCHTRTADMPAICKRADILIVSAGRAEAVDGRFLSSGQIVIDVGIGVNKDGALCGDVLFAEAERIVRAITPVPGGVGAVTSSVLAKHTVAAARRLAETKG